MPIKEKLKKEDLTLIFIYISFWICFGVIQLFELINPSQIDKLGLMIGYGISFILYTLYYGRLRETKVSLIWLSFGVIQLIYFLILYQHMDFLWMRGLLCLIAMVTSFNTSRYIYKFLYKEELIITANIKGFNPIIEGRELRFMDYLFSFMGAMVFGIIPILV